MSSAFSSFAVPLSLLWKCSNIRPVLCNWELFLWNELPCSSKFPLQVSNSSLLLCQHAMLSWILESSVSFIRKLSYIVFTANMPYLTCTCLVFSVIWLLGWINCVDNMLINLSALARLLLCMTLSYSMQKGSVANTCRQTGLYLCQPAPAIAFSLNVYKCSP